MSFDAPVIFNILIKHSAYDGVSPLAIIIPSNAVYATPSVIEPTKLARVVVMAKKAKARNAILGKRKMELILQLDIQMIFDFSKMHSLHCYKSLKLT